MYYKKLPENWKDFDTKMYSLDSHLKAVSFESNKKVANFENRLFSKRLETIKF